MLMATTRVHLASYYIVTVLCIVSSVVWADPISGDGFNIDKDLLRTGKGDDSDFVAPENGLITRAIYFYRTPPVQPDFDFDGIMTDLMVKRNSNKFKNFMLNKDGDGQAGEDVASSMSGRWVIPRTVPKRGAILNWAIPPANRVDIADTMFRRNCSAVQNEHLWNSSYRPHNHPRPSAMD